MTPLQRATALTAAFFYPFLLAASFGLAQKDLGTDFEYGIQTGMLVSGGLLGFVLLLAANIGGAFLATRKPIPGLIVAVATALLVPLLPIGDAPWTVTRAGIVLFSTFILTALLWTAFGGSRRYGRSSFKFPKPSKKTATRPRYEDPTAA